MRNRESRVLQDGRWWRTTVAFVFILSVVLVSLAGCAQPEPEEEPITPADIVDPNAPLKVTEEQELTDLIGDYRPAIVMLSPQGSAIAYARVTGNRPSDRLEELCIYSFADEAQECYVKPAGFEGPPVQLFWSPDDAYVAFHEDPLVRGTESDIWVLNVADGSFANLTDDGVTGAWHLAEQEFEIDYLPMWHPTDDMLYFWRSVPLGSAEVTRELYKISPQGGEAELVRDLSEYFISQLLVYDVEMFFMDGVSAISPDGTKIAMLSTNFIDIYAPENGMWVLDLTDESSAPVQIATMADFQAAVPAFQYSPTSPSGLSWTADGEGVVVLTANRGTNLTLGIFYYADPVNGGLTPVVDFGGYSEADREAFMTERLEAGLPMRYYSPWTATMSPGGQHLVMYNDLANTRMLMTAGQPPDGSLPTLAHAVETTAYPIARASRSSDGKVLIFHILFTTTED